MLGLTFQDDAADFEAGIDAVTAALGNMAGGDAAIRAHSLRKSMRRRRPDHEHRRAGLHEGRSREVEARRGRARSESAEAAGLRRLQSYLAGLATTLGFEVAGAV